MKLFGALVANLIHFDRCAVVARFLKSREINGNSSKRIFLDRKIHSGADGGRVQVAHFFAQPQKTFLLFHRSPYDQFFELRRCTRQRHPREISVASAQSPHYLCVESGSIGAPEQVRPLDIDEAPTETTKARVRQTQGDVEPHLPRRRVEIPAAGHVVIRRPQAAVDLQLDMLRVGICPVCGAGGGREPADELSVGLDPLRLSREFVLIGRFQVGAGDIPDLADKR